MCIWSYKDRIGVPYKVVCPFDVCTKLLNIQGLERLLITDSITHVVMDVDADLKKNQPLGVESIEMHLPLTSKYGSRVLLATRTSILLVCIASWSSIHIIMISYSVPKQRSAFVCFANLLTKILLHLDSVGTEIVSSIRTSASASGDFVLQTLYRGFAPGPQWRTSVPGPPACIIFMCPLFWTVSFT